ncbi:hypothetical protein KRX19_06110 [Cardiobacteriaceae bacterium TAE3-ERU3]|nr:hypothetical protein [Cardiobacteriaceae bacterium TAE3-ERU3]
MSATDGMMAAFTYSTLNPRWPASRPKVTVQEWNGLVAKYKNMKSQRDALVAERDEYYHAYNNEVHISNLRFENIHMLMSFINAERALNGKQPVSFADIQNENKGNPIFADLVKKSIDKGDDLSSKEIFYSSCAEQYWHEMNNSVFAPFAERLGTRKGQAEKELLLTGRLGEIMDVAEKASMETSSPVADNSAEMAAKDAQISALKRQLEELEKQNRILRDRADNFQQQLRQEIESNSPPGMSMEEIDELFPAVGFPPEIKFNTPDSK